MATFQIKVTDEAGAPIPNAKISFVDESGNLLADNAALQADATGGATFTNGSAELRLKVSAVGYSATIVTARPGITEIKLAVAGSGSTMPAAASFFQKNKTLLIILALLILGYCAWKFKWFGLGVPAV